MKESLVKENSKEELKEKSIVKEEKELENKNEINEVKTTKKEENPKENKDKNKGKKENKGDNKKENKDSDKSKKENKSKEINKEKEDKKLFKKAEEKPKKIEKEIKEMDQKEKKKKWPKILITVGILIIVLLFISTIFALVNINNEKIISGISIKGIDVAGLTKEEAKTKINESYSEKMQKEVNLKYQDYESSLNPTLMEVNYDLDKAIDEAYLIGKSDNIFINNYNILFALIAKKDVNVDMILNEDATKQSIVDIGTNLPGIILESSYYVEDDNLVITKGKEGIYVDTDNLLNKVKDNLNDINSKDDYIEIPVVNKKPEEINVDKIHEEVYKEVQDAYYTKDPFTLYPEVEGVDFDVEAAKALISGEDKEEYTIKLTITKPKVTINQIGSEAFPDQLATFTTRYDASNTDRTTNLRIACQKLNGKVILSGDTFSYNKTLGERTVAAGYRNGKVYENGQVVDGIGGGICQISSTLYNAVLMSNLEIVERRNHQFVTSYLPAGRDATVVYGMTDFKFKNTRQYPVRLAASVQNGIATISVYGIKEENEYTFSFETKTIATIAATTKYEEDASLPAGTEKVTQKGTNGLKTETYITKMLNGKVISKKLLSRDTYDAMARIVVRGTGGTSATTQEPVNQTPTEQKPTEQTPTQPTENTETTKPEQTTPTESTEKPSRTAE